MTVETELCLVERAWTGSETQFATGFKAKAKSYVKVTIQQAGANAALPLVLGVHFDVAIAPDDLVTVLPLALPTPPQTLVIERDTPATQGTKFEDLTRYSANVHEDLHDVSAMRDAELGERFGRTVMLPPGSASSDLVLPDPESGKYLRWKADLSGLENAPAPTIPAGAIMLGATTVVFETKADLEAATIASAVDSVMVLAYASAGDGGDAIYKRAASEPAHIFKALSQDLSWWEVSYANGLNLRAGGAGLGNAATDTAAMASALTIGTGTGANKTGIRIYLPQGAYTFTSGFTVDRHDTVIEGAGRRGTLINFTPSANATLFTVHNSAAIGPNFGGVVCVTLKGMKISSTDTTWVKTAINPKNTSILVIEDVLIDNWDDPTRESKALHYQGREMCRINNCDFYANKPIAFSQNPDRATYSAFIDADVFSIENSNLIVEPVSASVLNANINIPDGCHITRMSYRNVHCAGGKWAFNWGESGGASASSGGVLFDGFFYEQTQDATGATIAINFATADTLLRDIWLRNVWCANSCIGLFVAGLNGSSKMIENVHLDGFEYQGALAAINIDAGIQNFTWDKLNLPQTSSSVAHPGMTLRSGEYWRPGAPLPGRGAFASHTRDQVTWSGNESSGRRHGRIEYMVTLADDVSSSLTVFTDYDVKTARITVTGGGEGGVAVFKEGASLLELTGSANFDIADTDTDLCVIRASDASVSVRNRLGILDDFLITVEFSADMN